jgi:hypothetical protein
MIRINTCDMSVCTLMAKSVTMIPFGQSLRVKFAYTRQYSKRGCFRSCLACTLSLLVISGQILNRDAAWRHSSAFPQTNLILSRSNMAGSEVHDRPSIVSMAKSKTDACLDVSIRLPRRGGAFPNSWLTINQIGAVSPGHRFYYIQYKICRVHVLV